MPDREELCRRPNGEEISNLQWPLNVRAILSGVLLSKEINGVEDLTPDQLMFIEAIIGDPDVSGELNMALSTKLW